MVLFEDSPGKMGGLQRMAEPEPVPSANRIAALERELSNVRFALETLIVWLAATGRTLSASEAKKLIAISQDGPKNEFTPGPGNS